MTGKNRHFRDLSQQVLSGVVATGGGQVVYPVVAVDVDGIRCRAYWTRELEAPMHQRHSLAN